MSETPKRKGRRPKLLDPEIQKTLCAAIRAGATHEGAAAHVGIGTTTFYRWMDRGRTEEERIADGAEPDPDETPYREIWESVKKAQADAEIRNISVIQNAAAGGTWQAAAWWLERRMPSRYARRVEVAGTDTPVRLTVSVDEVEAKIAAMLSGETSE